MIMYILIYVRVHVCMISEKAVPPEVLETAVPILARHRIHHIASAVVEMRFERQSGFVWE